MQSDLSDAGGLAGHFSSPPPFFFKPASYYFIEKKQFIGIIRVD